MDGHPLRERADYGKAQKSIKSCCIVKWHVLPGSVTEGADYSDPVPAESVMEALISTTGRRAGDIPPCSRIAKLKAWRFQPSLPSEWEGQDQRPSTH